MSLEFTFQNYNTIVFVYFLNHKSGALLSVRSFSGFLLKEVWGSRTRTEHWSLFPQIFSYWSNLSWFSIKAACYSVYLGKHKHKRKKACFDCDEIEKYVTFSEVVSHFNLFEYYVASLFSISHTLTLLYRISTYKYKYFILYSHCTRIHDCFITWS